MNGMNRTRRQHVLSGKNAGDCVGTAEYQSRRSLLALMLLVIFLGGPVALAQDCVSG